MKARKFSRLDDVVGYGLLGSLSCLIMGAVLVTPFYGFLPVLSVVGGLFAAATILNLIESPQSRQGRWEKEARQRHVSE